MLPYHLGNSLGWRQDLNTGAKNYHFDVGLKNYNKSSLEHI
jgi:hypothetical protein